MSARRIGAGTPNGKLGDVLDEIGQEWISAGRGGRIVVLNKRHLDAIDEAVQRLRENKDQK